MQAVERVARRRKRRAAAHDARSACASSRYRGSLVIANRSAHTSFMPPCSRSSIFWNWASGTSRLAGRSSPRTSPAPRAPALLPRCRCASRRPASTLCVVYQGTPGEGLARETVGERRDAIGKRRQPAAGLRLALGQFRDDVVDALGKARVARGFVHAGRGGEVMAERVAVAADVDPRLDATPSRHTPAPWARARRSRGSCAACGRARAAVDRLRRASAPRGTGPAPSRTSREREVLRRPARRRGNRRSARRRRERRQRRTPAPSNLRASRRECGSSVMRLRPPGARRCRNAPAASPTSSRRPLPASSFVATTLFGLSKVLNALRSVPVTVSAGEHAAKARRLRS